ncbi:MAG TPA: hypothetical protein VJ783_07020 [Pirellulales bacterium]|nr:hypothetical protein [Pirellulales bacterium]
MQLHVSRRRFLAGGVAAALLGGVRRSSAQDASQRRLKVAAVFTEFTYRSHAHVILENFLEPYLFNGRRTEPGMDVVSFYGDQFPAGDMSRAVAKKFGITIFPTIGEALCRGGERLAVDAVLSIGEHGKYPVNAKGQTEYPRKRFFDEIVAVFERSGRAVPVFNDKHLSYRWDWAKQMYDAAGRLKIPLMAGSSVPLAQRRPVLELPEGAKIAEAVSIHGGPPEGYGFHALEVLQSFVEFRSGGETGISQVEYWEGDALWKAAEAGKWSPELADAAMAAELGPGQPPVAELAKKLGVEKQSHGISVHYRDGLRGLALGIPGGANRWNFACRLTGEPQVRATQLYTGPWNNRNLFKALSHAIQTHFRERRPPYPVERTLLVTGALDAAMDSRLAGTPLDTPQLEFAYQPRDFRAMREMGASWKIITDETPEPQGIEPVGL